MSKSRGLARHWTAVHDARLRPQETHVKYILLDYVREAGWPVLPPAEQKRWLGAYRAYIEAMSKAGVLRTGSGLQPTSAATTVRVADGQTQVLDGPYAETKEQLAGFHIIDVPDLDAAISWAARCPTALHGIVEVRPLMERSDNPVVQEFIDGRPTELEL